MPTAALFTKAKIWKQCMLPSTDEWIKIWYIYSIEYYSAIKRKVIVSFEEMWMGLKDCHTK